MGQIQMTIHLNHMWAFNSNTRYSLGHEWDSNAVIFLKDVKKCSFWSAVLTDDQIAGVFRAQFGRSGMSMSN